MRGKLGRVKFVGHGFSSGDFLGPKETTLQEVSGGRVSNKLDFSYDASHSVLFTATRTFREIRRGDLNGVGELHETAY